MINNMHLYQEIAHWKKFVIRHLSLENFTLMFERSGIESKL